LGRVVYPRSISITLGFPEKFNAHDHQFSIFLK
jgi:hypothetical protein